MNDETRNGPEDEAGGETDGESGKDGRESPGRLLQAARKRKGLSIDELVAQTLLSRDTLTALEADDFERLSQPVFVRGYYRKCAKILNLPEDELMAAYAAHAGVPGPRPVPSGQLDVIPQDVTPHGRRGLGLVLAVLAVLMVLAVAWWLIPRMGGDAATGMETPDGAERLTPGVPAGADTAASPPGGAADGTDKPGARLQLRFNERSWVEVRDAGGVRLLADILPAGSERTVVGRSPYEVLLGNAPGVEIRLDGERVAFGDRVRGDNTARLTVTRDAE